MAKGLLEGIGRALAGAGSAGAKQYVESYSDQVKQEALRLREENMARINNIYAKEARKDTADLATTENDRIFGKGIEQRKVEADIKKQEDEALFQQRRTTRKDDILAEKDEKVTLQRELYKLRQDFPEELSKATALTKVFESDDVSPEVKKAMMDALKAPGRAADAAEKSAEAQTRRAETYDQIAIGRLDNASDGGTTKKQQLALKQIELGSESYKDAFTETGDAKKAEEARLTAQGGLTVREIMEASGLIVSKQGGGNPAARSLQTRVNTVSVPGGKVTVETPSPKKGIIESATPSAIDTARASEPGFGSNTGAVAKVVGSAAGKVWNKWSDFASQLSEWKFAKEDEKASYAESLKKQGKSLPEIASSVKEKYGSL